MHDCNTSNPVRGAHKLLTASVQTGVGDMAAKMDSLLPENNPAVC